MHREELRKMLYSMSENELRDQDISKQENIVYKKSEEIADNSKKSFYNDVNFINNEFAIYQHKSYSKLPFHNHRNYIEVIYVYAGICKKIINGKEVLLVEGEVCILDMSVSHTILETTKDDIIISIVMLKSYISTSLLSRLSSNGIISNFLINAITQTTHQSHYIVFHCKKNPLFKELVENLMCEYFDQKICSKEIIDSYLVIILGELLRGYHKQNDHGKKNEPYLGELLQYIEQNYLHCTLKSTAEQFNLHPNYISTFIRKKTGKTFKALVQEQRMIKASSLLKHSTLNIDDISYEVGYKNLGFFYKKFQEQFDMTPYEYRNKQSSTQSKADQINENTHNIKKIEIKPQVFQSIAYKATSETEGVSKISEKISQSITTIFNGKKNHSGVEVEYDESGLKIKVYVSIKAGFAINDIAKKIQVNIHQMIFQITSIKTNEIYVNVTSIDFK